MTTHDALTYLPRTQILSYPKRSTIYDHSRPPERVYLLLAGRVHVFCASDNGDQTLLRVVAPEGFFGEKTLINLPDTFKETAIAAESAQVMSWGVNEISAQIQREPKLALALFTYTGKSNYLQLERIQAFMSCKTGMRVAIAFTQIARAIGQPTGNGAVRVAGLTHRAIGEYVGTTREIVTVEMNRLRRMGFLEYSRKFVDVHVDALSDWMRQQGVTLGQAREGVTAGAGR